MAPLKQRNDDDRYDRFLELADHINNDGRAVASVCLAPVAEGVPAFAQALPAHLEEAPDRELSSDENARLCLLIDEIAAVTPESGSMATPSSSRSIQQASNPATNVIWPDQCSAQSSVGHGRLQRQSDGCRVG